MNVMNILMVGCGLLLGSMTANAQDAHGVLRVVKGDVQIKSAKSGQTVKARLGEQVYPKDVIITGKDARAKIVMVDNNEINVSPESQIEIQHYEFDPQQGKKDVLLNVIYGKVRSKVEQHYDGKSSKFEVKTPSAVAGVRGTDFVTSYDKASNSSQVVTFRGAVAFGTPGPGGTIANAVSVTPGKMATSAGGSAPSTPTAVPKGDLNRMDQESKADTGGNTAANGKPAGSGSGRAPASGSSSPSPNAPGGAAAAAPPPPPPPTAAGPMPGGGGPIPGSGAGPMLQNGDTVTGNGGEIMPPPPVAGPSTNVAVPPPPAPPPIPTCTVCNAVIQNGKTQLVVHINR